MKKSFTLIEVLGVVALIAVLGALGYTGYSYAQHSAKESATKALITRLEAAVEAGRAKSGFVPESRNLAAITIAQSGGEHTITIGSTACKTNGTAHQQKFAKAFISAIEIDSMKRFLNDSNQIVDAWGNVIVFRYPGRFNKGGMDIISPGPDGERADDNDIEKFRDAEGDWICDDVANF